MIGWLILALLLAVAAVVAVRTARFKPAPEEAVVSVRPEVDADGAAMRLSRLIQCRTESHADEAEDDAAEYAKLEALLPELYPTVHKVCTREKIGRRGLLYRWRGQTDEAPIILTAHYDVVPAEDAEWKRPPFAGEIADGMIHGRGTLDTKCTLCAILEAAEALLNEGFTPARDVYLCFGGNEEIMGYGASEIVDALQTRGVRPAFVLDEGGAIVEKVFPGVRQPAALIGVAEKGSVNYQLECLSEGGHSSAPPTRSPVDRVARACVRIHDKPFPFRVTKPASMLFNGLACHSTPLYRMIFANLWLFGPVLNLLCRKSGGEMNALLRTTIAFTRMQGSASANVLPPRATMTLNARVLQGESIDGVRAALVRRAGDPKISVTVLSGSEPSGCSDVEGFACIRRAIREVYPGVLVSPYLMIASSDARYYEKLCGYVYRFSGMALSAEERHMIHGLDERLPVAKLADTVRFYRRVLENAQRKA